MSHPDPLREASRLGRSAAQLSGRDTERAREIARHLLVVRLKHALPDGRPDLAGNSAAYRTAVTAMYARTGVTGGELAQLKNRVRYHLANLVHEHMHREGIDPGSYGIHPRGRRAALREGMQRYRAGIDVDATEDPAGYALRALAEAVQCLTLATSPEALVALGALDTPERAQAERALSRVRDATNLVHSAL